MKTIVTPEETTIASEVKQPYWAKELTHSFAEKALNEQREMYHALFCDCKSADLDNLRKDITKYWPDYFSANDLVANAPLIAHLLRYVGRDRFHVGKTKECIEYLVNHCGASLNQPDEKGRLPLDCLIGERYGYVENSKEIYEAVKFVLTHGGRALKRREAVIRFLEYSAGMTRKDFEEFEAIGQVGAPKDIEKEAEVAANQVLARQADERRHLRRDLLERSKKVKSKYASDYDREHYQELLSRLTTTTAERKKKLEQVREAYRNKPPYLKTPLETEEQRKEKQFSVEFSEHMRKLDEQMPHRRGGVIPPHRNIFVGGVTRC